MNRKMQIRFVKSAGSDLSHTVRDGLILSKFRVEHSMFTLIELIQVKKKHEKQTLACKGDTLPAL
jgi:hypothetical protein